MRALFIAIIATCFGPLAWAQGSASAWQWEDIMRSARAHNTSVRENQALVEAAKDNRRSTYSGYLPTVNATGTRAQDKQRISGQGTTRDKTTEYALQTEVNLFNGFATTATRKRAEAEEDLAQANQAVAAVEVRHRLRRAYFELLLAQERRALAERAFKRSEGNAKLVQLKYQGGNEALWSVSKYEADIARSKVDLQTIEAEIRRLTLEIAALAGIDAQQIGFTGDLKQYLVELPAADGENILDTHPSARAAKADIEAAEENARLVRSEYLPALDAFFSVKRTKLDDREPINDSQVGLRLSINIFNGLSTHYNLGQANNEVQARELQRATVARDISLNLAQLRTDYEAKLSRTPVADLSLKAAQMRVRSTTEEYKLGLRRFLDWEQAERQLLEAESEQIRARREALLARADWERAVGMGLDEQR